MNQPASRRKRRTVSAGKRTKRVIRPLSKKKAAGRTKLGKGKVTNRRRTRDRRRKKTLNRKPGAGYNRVFDQSYNEGYNAGFAKGFEDGHQLAYEQQP